MKTTENETLIRQKQRYKAMQVKKIVLTTLTVAAVAAMTESCAEGGKTSATGDDITTTDYNQQIKSGAVTFKISDDDLTAYLTQSASVQWPEKMGDYDIKTLQDSLARYMFGDTTGKASIDKLMLGFIGNADSTVMSPTCRVEKVDTVPAIAEEEVRDWAIDVSAKVIEFNQRTITYEVISYNYLGGAHPNASIKPFTYDFESGTVYTNDNLFKQDATGEVLGVILKYISDKAGVPVSQLDEAGYFTPINVLGDPYVLDGQLVFHYDPYEIGPYAMGSVDITIDPSDLRSMMTPMGVKLFDSMLK